MLLGQILSIVLLGKPSWKLEHGIFILSVATSSQGTGLEGQLLESAARLSDGFRAATLFNFEVFLWFAKYFQQDMVFNRTLCDSLLPLPGF